jgi:hypothetical protein
LLVLPHGFIYKLIVSKDNHLYIEWLVAALLALYAREG